MNTYTLRRETPTGTRYAEARSVDALETIVRDALVDRSTLLLTVTAREELVVDRRAGRCGSCFRRAPDLSLHFCRA